MAKLAARCSTSDGDNGALCAGIRGTGRRGTGVYRGGRARSGHLSVQSDPRGRAVSAGRAVGRAGPREIIVQLNTAVAKALQDPELEKRFTGEGAQIIPNTPEEFASFIRAESVKWGGLAKSIGAKLD